MLSTVTLVRFSTVFRNILIEKLDEQRVRRVENCLNGNLRGWSSEA